MSWHDLQERLETFRGRTLLDEWLNACYPLWYLSRLVITSTKQSADLHYPARHVPACAVIATFAWCSWLNVRALLYGGLIEGMPRVDKLFDHVKRKWDPPSSVPDRHLDTAIDTGLSRHEVKARRRIYVSTISCLSRPAV